MTKAFFEPKTVCFMMKICAHTPRLQAGVSTTILTYTHLSRIIRVWNRRTRNKKSRLSIQKK